MIARVEALAAAEGITTLKLADRLGNVFDRNDLEGVGHTDENDDEDEDFQPNGQRANDYRQGYNDDEDLDDDDMYNRVDEDELLNLIDLSNKDLEEDSDEDDDDPPSSNQLGVDAPTVSSVDEEDNDEDDEVPVSP